MSTISRMHESPAAPPRARAMRARGRRRRGVGMVELLVALSISASLLAATAVAVNAAFQAYHVNQEQTVLLSKARVSLAFMTNNVRGTKLHAPDNAGLRTQFATGLTVTDAGLTMYDVDDNLMTFRYDAANKRLLVIKASGTQVMARGVEAFSVTLEPMRSAQSIKTGGGWDLLKRATFQITVKTAGGAAANEATGKQTLTLSASVMPRRNAW